MLKKENRISSRKEFADVKMRGRLVSTPLFSVVWLTNKNIDISSFERKFGAIISKKISKKAVERNRIRRRLMEAVRRNMGMFPEGYRGIFLVKKNILNVKEGEIEECLKKMFNPPTAAAGPPSLDREG